MPKLYALLVGINQYHPDSNVDNLYGCVNDVETMADFLREQFTDHLPEPGTQIKTLLNEEATRENLINIFTEHLGKANEEDYALFYYSGHGSYETTSVEFRALDGETKNETLVCYDSRLPGHYDLADKELAVLINNLQGKAQKIIILDSCHSGSATRSMEEVDFGRRRQSPAKRHTNVGEAARPISSYLLSENNYYANLVKEGKPPKVPEANHLLLSACGKKETALETTSGRGLFSYHLVQTLSDYKTEISYKDLFVKIRAAIQQSRAGQTPQLEPVGFFNPQYRFLSKISIDEQKYLVKWVKDRWSESESHWSLELGAVHGLPTEVQEIGAIKLLLKPAKGGTASDKGLPASIERVDITSSRLDFEAGDKALTYEAEIVHLPLSLSLWVYVNGDAAHKELFYEYYENYRSSYLEFVEQPGACQYELQLRDQGLYLFHRPSRKFLTGCKDLKDQSVEEMVKNLHKIEKWERIRKIHKQPEHLEPQKFVFKCQELDANNQVVHEAEENQITLTLEKKDGKWQNSNLSISAVNESGEDLNVLTLFMGRFFDIIAVKNTTLPANGTTISLFLHELTILDPKLLQVVDFIKVIISTTQLAPVHFIQEKMKVGELYEIHRFSKRLAESYATTPKFDWFTETFVVTLSGNEATIGPQPVQVSNLNIGPHPSFQARLSFAPIQAYNMDKNVINQLPNLLQNSAFEIINFCQDEHADDQSIVILTDIKNTDHLAENPLEISFPDVGEDHVYIPVTYDGELLTPFGETAASQNGQAAFQCKYLPTKKFLQRKDQPLTLQFCILKTQKPTIRKNTGLAWFDYKREQKDKRISDNLKEKIAEAQQILLLIPGIVKDTLEMAEGLQFAVDNNEVDLILTFDYDAFEQSIGSLAKQLQESLIANGLSAGHTKKLKIIGYSTGCLIARYWLEVLGKGQEWGEKALFIAPPNQGLESKNISAYFKRAFAFAFNFQPVYVLPILSKLQPLKSSSPGGNSTVLNDLQPDSSVLQHLANSTESATDYQIIAGDLSDFPTNSEQEIMAKLETEMSKMTGPILSLPQTGDSVISLNSAFDIQFVPTDKKITVPCMHYHYFEDGTTLAKVAAWIKEKF